jgi:hypothetical protein
MSISTINNSEDKKENLRKLREFHKNTIAEIGIDSYFLVGKMCYLSPRGEKVISFFHSEINKGNDIFLEFTDRFNNSEDPDRTLYQWKFNPHFEEEYDKADADDPTKVRYLVPVDELKVIKKYSQTANIKAEKETKSQDFGMPDPSTDPPINEMTIRDLAAIMLNKPVSNKQWLNDIIKSKK